MSEAETIFQTPSPRTRESLAADLRQIGITPGAILLVHSSLKSLGWVCGGPVTVIQAFMDVLTTTGTLVMPSHSGEYSDPAEWQNPPVPSEWVQIIRDTMPAFDARLTPTRGMGKIAETFRTFPDVVRSSHPTSSFAAWGKHAPEIINNHSLDYCLGNESPLARLYDLNASVLLLGVGYDSNTCFHLAEYRITKVKQITQGSPIVEGEQRVWKTYRDIELKGECFEEMGTAFEQAGHVKSSHVGNAQTKLFLLRSAVDWAVSWLEKER
ncbi:MULTISPECIES: AAC(3) family N-acetyltransferase [Nostocales]|uniref:Aminoglycoside N(3)-acetyltransferase n=3 Tax=Nostocales TaxID=1161 RepID=A0A0C1RDE0_9CYAN|nr:AAC(3) family N-acetyltransferase [Tolypothrix bouteillei]KAF3884306.1 AAC(3) family N-acetyltransferase [Tolypothrix bouteillei VB521301]